MIKLVKRLIQKPYEAKNKTDYIRHKLESGQPLSQLGMYEICKSEGVPHMFTIRLSARISDLRGDGMNIKTRTVKSKTNKRVHYAEYYI